MIQCDVMHGVAYYGLACLVRMVCLLQYVSMYACMYVYVYVNVTI